ncbi:DUF1254 domain-containing protein [Paraflavitalea sp. CAU 1676]|uniref:DUF1254 domain-containing protein n=1 Tax=Paraflavitalea sp. CAU 1676 TaxID=3032598 RepID=UPI0023DCE28C|nr:DUF1254 domain-containing protein [Paraflavitalea sp. CAU 1676]MDF2190394.1 DUF1254 domain-containing protein [Paraflavitalea sp. CAU 1676]
MKTHLLILTIVALLTACSDRPAAGDTTKAGEDVVSIAKEAYLYGLPIVLMDITRRQMNNPQTGTLYAEPNHFRHNSEFPDASFRNVVRPNADTYYSIAFLDLSKGPLTLSVPDTKGRYYMLPMMDAYTNVFAAPGTRTTGNQAHTFLVAGPQYAGATPAGTQLIQAPTDMVWIIGRTQVNSKQDGDRIVIPLQKQFILAPSGLPGQKNTGPVIAGDTSFPKGDPNAIVAAMPVETFFQYVNALLYKYPPPAADSAVLRRFAHINVGPGKKFELHHIPSGEQEAVSALPKEIADAFDQSLNDKTGLVSGWNIGHKVIGTYGTDYLSRAAVAHFGLGANLREDAIYPSAGFDATGQPLDGANRYVLHFEKGKTPPANAFWSLTMYDPAGYFVGNPINRYTLGDRSKLTVNADGSTDIYLQKDNPGKEKESNWLPAPPGPFNILMRVYWPKEDMLNRTWTPPGIQKLP